MTPEREKLIRDAWTKVEARAMGHFARDPVFHVDVRTSPPIDWTSPHAVIPETVTRERLAFVHEVENATLANVLDPIRYRIVCEGLVLVADAYPPVRR